ncbi:HAD-superfamily phosphatase [Ophiocordyceps camponoti-floridani]|uniref:HAD-superfamily phosphatase n=1 Tax=Ophiocordyceps camponoti-floridani TaxID=2030778 RepID=A0A8H4VCE1_9HYPO|nr:HAD-superfamily phosphatase [Ophiocordyceps camponoti-floridani]
MNPNVSASFNIWRLLLKPGLCLPHHTAATFNDLPIPLDAALRENGREASIKAVVLDKDDCFASPSANQVYEPYKQHFEALKRAYPGRRLLVVSNTAGAASWDSDLKQAADVERNTGVTVLAHSVKKPGCGSEIMAYFRSHPETGVTDASQVAIVGDRLMTDVMMANMMGSWAFWIRDGVVPPMRKSFFSRMERKLAGFLMVRGVQAPIPTASGANHKPSVRTSR